MYKFVFSLIVTFTTLTCYAQVATAKIVNPKKPKLVVGIVIDQMRWDYLQRFQNRYGKNGFNRLITQGYSCNQTYIPYTPSVTAVGHSCIYTGSVPAINGIIGNNWYNTTTNKTVYCCDDTTVKCVGGGNPKAGQMSPANMHTTTITDELRLSNNMQSKVIAVCIKDRGAILPGGHTANAAYWYDGKTGNWISSTHYTNALPAWLTAFNLQKNYNKYYAQNWNTLYPINTYTLATADNMPYEAMLKNDKTPTFPHNLQQYIDTLPDQISSTPYGNNFTIDVAKLAIQNEKLGKGTATDFLALSLSSPDYIGHKFGPNSIEMEDNYLRLDETISAFLTYLDSEIGKDKYTIFLTADHGVAHIPAFNLSYKIPSGTISYDYFLRKLNPLLKEKYGVSNLILNEQNYQLYLNQKAIVENNINEEQLNNFIIKQCEAESGVAQAFALANLSSTTLQPTIKDMLANGYNKKRSGHIQLILQPAYIDGGKTGTTHGLWNPYDTHLPMLWYGTGINKGSNNNTMYMTDIVPTLAMLLGIQVPNGCVGNVMQGVLK